MYSLQQEVLTTRIYLLRRSTMLGRFLQHPDDIEYQRMLFLNSPVALAQRMLDTTIHIYSPADNYTVPQRNSPEDMALQPKWVVLLDSEVDIYVWYGEEATDEAAQHCLTQYLSTLPNRFPYPHTLCFSVSFPSFLRLTQQGPRSQFQMAEV